VRIIAGVSKGRKLHPLKGIAIRPTADHLRESIFNILAGYVEGAVVLDLFAGTGSLGMEALSRGAASCVFVDSSRKAVELLNRNILTCGLQEQCTILKRDVLRGLNFLIATGHTFDLVFMDPPYNRGYVEQTLRLLGDCKCIANGGYIIVEHSRHETLSRKTAHFEQSSERQYGKSLVSFYESVL